ncbi:MAG: SufE family protein [Chitinophagales bacterium]|nr:SufE family protein [Chitinophagales bacterium]
MSQPANTEEEIISEFEVFDDPMDKYEYIIDLGKKLPPLDPRYMTDEYLVKGCQSKVWLHAYEKDGKIYYEADSNTAITRGIVALLIRALSGKDPHTIVNSPLSFIDAIRLRSYLSSQRNNGLTAMIQRMKDYARAYIK